MRPPPPPTQVSPVCPLPKRRADGAPFTRPPRSGWMRLAVPRAVRRTAPSHAQHRLTRSRTQAPRGRRLAACIHCLHCCASRGPGPRLHPSPRSQYAVLQPPRAPPAARHTGRARWAEPPSGSSLGRTWPSPRARPAAPAVQVRRGGGAAGGTFEARYPPKRLSVQKSGLCGRFEMCSVKRIIYNIYVSRP